MSRQIKILALLFVLTTALWVPIASAELGELGLIGEGDDDIVAVPKVVSGEVSAISSNFINIIYEKNSKKGVEYEMPMKVDSDVQLKHKLELKEIKVGDTVLVRYDEMQQEAERPKKNGTMEQYTKVLSRHARLITFLRPAKTDFRSKD